MRFLLFLTTLFVLLRPAADLTAAEFLDPKVAFQPAVRALDAQTLEVTYTIAKGYYLYRDKFKFATDNANLGAPVLPPGKVKKDENFGDVEVYFNQVAIRLPLAGVPANGPIALQSTSMGCADGGICYPPQTQTVSLDWPPLLGAATSAGAGGDESGRIARLLRDASFAWVLLSFFGFGLLLSLTPCVLPMLPILSGIIVGRGEKVTRSHALGLSLAYVFGMALTYAAAGIAAGFTGTLASTAFQNPWVLSAFGLVFVVLSLSMFGFYELQLPSFLQSKLSEEANALKGGSYYSVATMGALSALIVGPCVAAPLAGALLYIGQTGDALLGGAALFTLALGMGVPLIVVGASAGHLMPKSGPWMEAVKKVFGVVLLGTAVWFVTPVIPAWAQMLAWAVLLIVPAVFLHALDPLPPASSGWRRLWKGVGVLMLLYGAALLIGTLAGGRDPLQPLKALSAGAPPGDRGARQAEAATLPYRKVGSSAELDLVLKTAGQPVMLDFYADWCVSCKEMERFTFSDPGVRSRLGRFVLVQADVTANTADDAALLKRFSLFGPPGIIFFDAQGGEIAGQRIVGFQNADTFVQQLDAVLQRAQPGPLGKTGAVRAAGTTI
jgi:thioredoxin:protein disulfide reductase